ncbi:HAD hydrolase-like protein [uncultured Roseovarius sp.]|uniref:HAD-IIA family hydrolase n=1 Tax=uncultured Roseovarius sp. TaxID=293344 RepID=UPI002628DAD9|nr:HAD hydrolase-like protein [uncultured Roseovarius sp.]
MDTVATIFDRYEAVRGRLPSASFPGKTSQIDSLHDIASHADAFVFDAYGVLNIGEAGIPGASQRLKELRDRGQQIRILSNAASYNHDGAAAKFRTLDMGVGGHEIITSRDATLAHLEQRLWGCIAAPQDDLSDIPAPARRLVDDPTGYDEVDGFLFLSTEVWSLERQALLEASLLANPRPVVIANADLVAPREHGFSLEPGYFGHLLADRDIPGIRFFGKPFSTVYEMIEASLPGIPPDRIVMCGDTLHTDILGAAARGWQTVLVENDGLFSGEDTCAYFRRADLFPTWRLSRI